jgi:Rrf2 family protein
LAYLAAQPAGRTCQRKEIAEENTIPPFFLGKILGQMVRSGLLHSTKGPNGGFLLAKPPQRITLYEIKAALNGIDDLEECVAGLGNCRRASRCCPLHEGWRPLQLQLQQYLQQTTVADLIKSETSGEGWSM